MDLVQFFVTFFRWVSCTISQWQLRRQDFNPQHSANPPRLLMQTFEQLLWLKKKKTKLVLLVWQKQNDHTLATKSNEFIKRWHYSNYYKCIWKKNNPESEPMCAVLSMNVFTCVVVPFVSTCPPHMFACGQLHDATDLQASTEGWCQVLPGEFGITFVS